MKQGQKAKHSLVVRHNVKLQRDALAIIATYPDVQAAARAQETAVALAAEYRKLNTEATR